MRLTSARTGNSVDLSITGYQFPRIASDWPDAIGEGWRARFTPANAADLSARFVASGTGQESVSLTTAGQYDVPAQANEDSNWLVIRIDLVSGGTRLHTVEPCLTTHEARELADFLDSGLCGELTFLEPTLRISVGDGGPRDDPFDAQMSPALTRIRVGVEPLPPGLPAEVELDINPDELRSAIRHWRGQLAIYPVR